jgi:hypothetical protein
VKRRIYISPDSGLEDNTTSPTLWDCGHDDSWEDTPDRLCRTGVLYDDALWEQYQTAEAEVSRLRRLVCEALIQEPYTRKERDLAKRARAILDGGYSREAMDACEAEALELAVIGSLARPQYGGSK